MARKKSEWVPLSNSYEINSQTFRNLRMKPGISNVDVYVAGPADETYLPESVSPKCGYADKLFKQLNESLNGGEKRQPKHGKYT